MIDHLHKKFTEVLSNDKEQYIGEHMVKFKGHSGMKQYIKCKPIKRNFKFWFMCSSKTRHLYQKDIYLDKKQNTEFNLGEEVVCSLPRT